MAGSNDFTGQNIQDTYQRVLQLSSSGQLADGTGSLVPLLNVTASFAISASHEITLELSSSYAETASFVDGLTGTNSGDITLTGTPDYITISGQEITRNQIDLANDVTGILPSANLDADTAHLSTSQTFTGDKTFSGAVTASAGLTVTGNISASGDITATGYAVNSVSALDNSGATLRLGANNTHTKIEVGKEGTQTEGIKIFGNITASGNGHISTSGDIYGNSFDTGNSSLTSNFLDIDGSTGDGSGYGNVTIKTGKEGYLGLSPYSSSIFETRGAMTTIIDSANADSIDGKTKFWELRSGGIWPSTATNFIYSIDLGGNITSSGNISASKHIKSNTLSASANIYAPNIGTGVDNTVVILDSEGNLKTDEIDFRVWGTTLLNGSGVATRVPFYSDTNTLDDDASFTFDGTTLISNVISSSEFISQGHITASGNISASGDIDGDIYKSNGVSVFTNSGGTTTINSVTEASLFQGTAIRLNAPVTASHNISASLDLKISAGTGSFHRLLGDTSQDTALHIEGSITASSNISSSGKFIGNELNFTGAGNDFIKLINNSVAIKSADTSITLIGNVTASNDISASGTSHTFGGNISIDQDLLHIGDSDTKFSFSDADTIDLQTGGSIRLRLNNTLNTLNQDTKVDGDLEVDGHITASGNISASGNFIGQDMELFGNSFTMTHATTPTIRLKDTTNNYFVDLKMGNSFGIEVDGSANSNFYIATNEYNGNTATTTALFMDGGTGLLSLNDEAVAIDVQGNISASGNISGSDIEASGTISGQYGLLIHSKSNATDSDAKGDVVYFGSGQTLDAGKIYHYKSDGSWEIANATAVATSDGLLGVALATAPSGGILLRGMVTLDHDPGTTGQPLYLDTGNNGQAIHTISSTNNHIVRVIGYCLDDDDGQIWFNPDNTFVEITA